MQPDRSESFHPETSEAPPLPHNSSHSDSSHYGVDAERVSLGGLSQSSRGSDHAFRDDEDDDLDDERDETPVDENEDVSAFSYRNRNRIEEYERATSSRGRHTSEYGFTVVPMPAGHIPKVTLMDFPNEVLMHVFSHLPPGSLADLSLSCRRFHDLITTPHAWRTAFSRFFTGPASLVADTSSDEYDNLVSQCRSFARLNASSTWRNEYILRSKLLRSLARGKPADSYAPASSRHAPSAVATYRSQLLYPITHVDASFSSNAGRRRALFIHGTDMQGLATVSEPLSGNHSTSPWNTDAILGLVFRHFNDIYPDVAEYGMGTGSMIGVPNSMDTSQQFGYIYGEGVPGGRVFYQDAQEKRGKWLPGWGLSEENALARPEPRAGIPDLNAVKHANAITSVWIAKNPSIVSMSQGMVGAMVGCSTGVLIAYSVGSRPNQVRRYERGQVTAKWAICPGVPITSITVDENYNATRSGNKRVWAVVLNALGEVYYLRDLPAVPSTPPVPPEFRNRMTEIELATNDQNAWLNGRSVKWELIEPTRRVLRGDAVGLSQTIHVSPEQPPCSGWIRDGLSESDTATQTWEVQRWLALSPSILREIYDGWDMRRKVEVDFAGGGNNEGGESVVVICTGWMGNESDIKRYTRVQTKAEQGMSNASLKHYSTPLAQASPVPARPSLFGGPIHTEPSSTTRETLASAQQPLVSGKTGNFYEWRVTDLDFLEKGAEITATAIDKSVYATSTSDEDSMASVPSGSGVASPAGSAAGTVPTTHGLSSPALRASPSGFEGRSATELPGQRGRYLAIGTSTGAIVLWDIRTHPNWMSESVNTLKPLRVIHTESPEISSLALTALYVVHGGNDGLVQAWDPLASTNKPIRVLHSRFSSRARKHLIYAQRANQLIGTNWFAANAIVLDPDPTSLCGMVALGSHLRFWAYSSSGTEGLKGSKRRHRLSARGSHAGGATESSYLTPGKHALRKYIASEEHSMRLDQEEREKEQKVLSNRFGVDLLGSDATEEEMLAYAQLLSEEAHEREMKRQREEEEAVRARAREQEAQAKTDEGEWEEIPPELLQEASPSFNPPDANGEAPVHAGPAQSSQGAIGENIDDDLAEALRLSLLDAESQRPSPGHADIHDQPSSATYIHDHIDAQGGESSSGSALQTGNNASSDAHQADAQGKEELDPDLAYAIQLSLAEEESRKHAEMLALQRGEDEDWAFLDNQGADTFSYENDDEEAKDDEEFPPLKGSKADKGKGKARA